MKELHLSAPRASQALPRLPGCGLMNSSAGGLVIPFIAMVGDEALHS
jgi:hypothetical protein